MNRFSSPLIACAILCVGFLLGVGFDRGRRLEAQSARISTLGKDDDAPPASTPPTTVRGHTDDELYDQLARQYEQFEHVNRTFEMVSKAVSPSVVHLVSHKFGAREADGNREEFEETGSGVIVRSEAPRGLFVLTNNHVVVGASADQINVNLSDGRSFHPSKVWTDSKADVAVLKLERNDLPAARLGNSDDAAVGSWVLAMGSPFGLNHSVSQGIISGRGRHEFDLEKAGVENQDFLQTDAAINPGNSGGPLVNMKGEVIGLNIAILSNGGGSEGVGFSIPINLARWIMGQLLSNGRVNRGALGVKLLPDFEPDNAVAIGLERPRGAMIESVDQQSPAALGGVKVGDVVLRFNGVEVVDLNHLINLVSMATIGQSADVVVWRDRRELPLKVMVADKERIVAQSTRLARPSGSNATMGIDLVTLDPNSSRRLGLPDSIPGAAITKVEAGSPLQNYLQPLDVIYAVGGKPIRTADEVVDILGTRRVGSGLEFGIHRAVEGGYQRFRVRVP